MGEGSNRYIDLEEDRSSSDKEDQVSQLSESDIDLDESALTDFDQSQSEERMMTIGIDLVIDQIPNLQIQIKIDLTLDI